MATAQEPPPKNVSFSPGEAGGVMLHRHGGADSYDLGLTAKAILKTFEQTIADRESHALVVWPQPTHGISVIHALAALARISGCDTHRLTTVLFPWNRNAGASQKALLVDREQLVRPRSSHLTESILTARNTPLFATCWRCIVSSISQRDSRGTDDTRPSKTTQAFCIRRCLRSCPRSGFRHQKSALLKITFFVD
jgi:hypothetical protein